MRKMFFLLTVLSLFLVVLMGGCSNSSPEESNLLTQKERNLLWEKGTRSTPWNEATEYFPNKNKTTIDELFEIIIAGKTNGSNRDKIFASIGYNQLNSEGDNFFTYATHDISRYLSKSVEYQKNGRTYFKTEGGFGYDHLKEILNSAVVGRKLEVNYRNNDGVALIENLQNIYREISLKGESKDILLTTISFIELLKENGAIGYDNSIFDIDKKSYVGENLLEKYLSNGRSTSREKALDILSNADRYDRQFNKMNNCPYQFRDLKISEKLFQDIFAWFNSVDQKSYGSSIIGLYSDLWEYFKKNKINETEARKFGSLVYKKYFSE